MGRSGKSAAKKRRLLEKAAGRPSNAKPAGTAEGLYWIDTRGAAQTAQEGACRVDAGPSDRRRARSCTPGGSARKKRRRAIVDSDVDVSDSVPEEDEDEEQEHARLIREDFAQNCSSNHGRR